MSFVAPAAGLFNFTPALWLNNKNHILDHVSFTTKVLLPILICEPRERFPLLTSGCQFLCYSALLVLFRWKRIQFWQEYISRWIVVCKRLTQKEVEEVPGVQVIMGYFPQCMWSWDISKHLIWTHLRPLCSVHRDVIRQTFAHTHPQRLLIRWW